MMFVEICERGRDAFARAMEEIERGRGVVLPRGDLSLEEESRLKRLAFDRGLLVLGPGCTSSHLEGKGIGIWNSVKKGPVGIISTGGSGIRELTALLQDVGVSNSLCVGPRDLSQRVGGLGAIMAIRYLSSDPDTEVILLASRTPPSGVARAVLGEAERCGKPAIMCFLGEGLTGFKACGTFEEAASCALGALGREPSSSLPADMQDIAAEERSKFAYGQRYVRGLFSGGMLCLEAQAVLRERLASVHSNVPLSPRSRLPDPHSSRGHACVDMGDPELSEAHPAVDLSPRCRRILREAGDLEAAVLLLDVMLGNGAHPDPARELAEAIVRAREKAEETGGYLSTVVSIVGTDLDPQGLPSQRKTLERAGAIIAPSNASASELAAMIVRSGQRAR